MTLGKMVTGIWLVRFSLRPFSSLTNTLKRPIHRIRLFCTPKRTDQEQKEKKRAPNESSTASVEQATGVSDNLPKTQDQIANRVGSFSQNPASQSKLQEDTQATAPRQTSLGAFPPKPKSLYPPSILGLAKVARGEIGYLIASLAQSQGIFPSGPSGQSSEIYLVIIWAISICTPIGPICVGTLVKRVKRLQETRRDHGSDPLGVWGI